MKFEPHIPPLQTVTLLFIGKWQNIEIDLLGYLSDVDDVSNASLPRRARLSHYGWIKHLFEEWYVTFISAGTHWQS